MKEFNLIALLGFYLICPPDKVAAMGRDFMGQNIIEVQTPQAAWHDVYFLEQKNSLEKTATAKTQYIEPAAQFNFSNSKPVIQQGKRFLRPKIIE
jgi:hypothetical protein